MEDAEHTLQLESEQLLWYLPAPSGSWAAAPAVPRQCQVAAGNHSAWHAGTGGSNGSSGSSGQLAEMPVPELGHGHIC